MSTSTSPSSPDRRPANKSSLRDSSRKYLPWLGAVLLLALIAAGLWPKALPVEIATVERGNVVVTVDEEGMTRVKNRYLISSPVAGQLQRIDWKPGTIVKAGETILAVLETSGADLLDARGQAEAEARVRGAEANRQLAGAQLERARAAHALAKNDLVRFRELAERKAISQQELEIVLMRETTTAQEARAAEFAQQVAEFELQQARALLVRRECFKSARRCIVSAWRSLGNVRCYRRTGEGPASYDCAKQWFGYGDSRRSTGKRSSGGLSWGQS